MIRTSSFNKKKNHKNDDDNEYNMNQKKKKKRQQDVVDFILLSGSSGTGKTAIALTLQERMLKQREGIFIKTKYDAKSFRDDKNEPYSGIGDICNKIYMKLCEQCCSCPSSSKDEFAIKIWKEIEDRIDKSQIKTLKSIVPAIISSFPTNADKNEPFLVDDNGMKDENNDVDEGDGETQDTLRKKRIFPSRLLKRQNSKGILSIATDTSSQNSIRNFSVRQKQSSGIDAKSSKEILMMAFRRLFKILIDERFLKQQPIVILLDDLQWADSSSLELIGALLKDQDITNKSNKFMFIGCYRSDEVNNNHILSRTIRTLMEEQDRYNYAIKKINVGNLSLESVDLYISKVLDSDNSNRATTKGLSTICHKRTLGNIFFVRVFLTSLQDSNLLVFNHNDFRWKWDELKIKDETAATSNLIKLLLSKMNQFSDSMLLLLKITSCLGYSFSEKTIKMIWRHLVVEEGRHNDNYGVDEKMDDDDDDLLIKLLQIAVDENFFEITTATTDITSFSPSYRFVHDKVQEAASLLIPEDEYESFRSIIGVCLYQYLEEEELNRMIFVVVDMINSSITDSGVDEKKKRSIININAYKMASLNLKAADKSMELSAFHSAARYAEMGIQHLHHHNDAKTSAKMWNDESFFHLTLLLHTICAEAHAYIGNSEKADYYCKEVKMQKNGTPFDKMRVYKLMIEQLHLSCKLDDSWDLCLQIFDEMGYGYPRNQKLQQLKSMQFLWTTTKWYLPTVHEISSMNFIEDPSMQETIVFLVQAACKAMATGNMSMYVLICCQCVRLTKKYGLAEFTGSAFASFANVLMHQNGDWKTAKKVAEAALAIQDRLNSNYTRTSVVMKASVFVLGWTNPLKNIWSDLMEAYRLGILSGNLEGASLSIIMAIGCQFYSGTPLQDVSADLQTYIPQIEDMKAEYMVHHLRLIWQMVLNLIGNDKTNPNTTIMKGSALNWETSKDTPPPLLMFARHTICYCCMHFSEYEKGAEIALDMEDGLYKKFLGSSYFGSESFPRGLCLYAMARRSTTNKGSRKKYWDAARKVRQDLKRRVKLGGSNFLHQLWILEGEEAVLLGKEIKAKKSYGAAISTAARSGFLQDAGVANERYASYLLSIQQLSDAQYYMKQAIRFYTDWGAIRKVTLLEKSCTGFFEKTS